MLDAAIDRLVWYAGWADKLAQVVGNANPVAGPFFNLSTPEPTGVVAVLAPQESSLLGLVSVVAPVIVSGNTAVVVSSYRRPAARGDVQRGAGHLRRPGRRGQRAHRRRDDRRARGWPRTWTSTRSTCAASPVTPTLAAELEVAAAENLKRVRRAPAAEPDWSAEPGLDAMTAFLETKTVWHPIGV